MECAVPLSLAPSACPPSSSFGTMRGWLFPDHDKPWFDQTREGALITFSDFGVVPTINPYFREAPSRKLLLASDYLHVCRSKVLKLVGMPTRGSMSSGLTCAHRAPRHSPMVLSQLQGLKFRPITIVCPYFWPLFAEVITAMATQ